MDTLAGPPERRWGKTLPKQGSLEQHWKVCHALEGWQGRRQGLTQNGAIKPPSGPAIA